MRAVGRAICEAEFDDVICRLCELYFCDDTQQQVGTRVDCQNVAGGIAYNTCNPPDYTSVTTSSPLMLRMLAVSGTGACQGSSGGNRDNNAPATPPAMPLAPSGPSQPSEPTTVAVPGDQPVSAPSPTLFEPPNNGAPSATGWTNTLVYMGVAVALYIVY